MADQYFAARPSARRREETIRVALRGHTFVFDTDAGVFARGKLDRGTELLAQHLTLAPDAHVLDIGCGYGVLGIVAATLAPNGRVVMTDVNERAIDLAARNVRANAVPHADARVGPFYEPVAGETFDAIVSNPPIRAGKEAVFRIVDEAPGHLRRGAFLWMVARTRQGARSLEAHIAERLGACATVARGSGYRVFRAGL
ncbi:MAG TPA: methyltransferase [Thermoplasmata archaeon]|nr:methyltransferase [Thermoplasmata archaeon]